MQGGGIFENDAFHWNVGFGLGELPEGAALLSQLAGYRRIYPSLPTNESLINRGASHFTFEHTRHGPKFTWYDQAGRNVGFMIPALPSGAVLPEPEKMALPARRESDGLIASQAPQPQREGFRWQPYAATAGVALALMALGGAAYMAWSK